MRLQTKIMLILIVLFALMLISVNAGVGWWRYRQYQDDQLRQQAVMRNAFNNIVQTHIQELVFLGEAVVRNKKLLKSSKCYVGFLSGKNAKRCAKKTLALTSFNQTPDQMSRLFMERISADANNTFNYFEGKNEFVTVFDLLFEGKIIWRQNTKQLYENTANSALVDHARQEKKSAFGIEQGLDDAYRLYGLFAHYNPKEYYFSRIGMDLQLLLQELLHTTGSEMLIFEDKRLLPDNVEDDEKAIERNINTQFGGWVDIQDWQFVYKIPIPVFGNHESTEFIYVIKDGKKELVSSIKGFGVIVLGITGILVAGIILLILFFSRNITKPITEAVGFTTEMAKGDLTQHLYINRKDEIGILSESLNNMVSIIGRMLKEMANGIDTLSSSSDEFSDISQQMSQKAGQTSGRSNTVAAAAEEMSANVSGVASASEQTSENVNMVATSAEEMSVTISEIAQNTEKAQSISNNAVAKAHSTMNNVDELGTAAQDISKVTETITEISEQTNLLALNATIEAARAGEAGKGFAVVANEIKELSHQTAKATTEIKEKIDSIQLITHGAVNEIQEISKVIDDVNDIVTTIASAIEDQSTVSKEIAVNVAQASDGIKTVNENITHASTVSQDIAKEITEVNLAADEIDNISAQVNSNANDLHHLASKISKQIRQFKIR